MVSISGFEISFHFLTGSKTQASRFGGSKKDRWGQLSLMDRLVPLSINGEKILMEVSLY